MADSAAAAATFKSTGTRGMIGGVIAIAIGIGITAVTYQNASGGDSYVFAWGPILFGIVAFFRGLARFAKGASMARRVGAAPAPGQPAPGQMPYPQAPPQAYPAPSAYPPQPAYPAAPQPAPNPAQPAYQQGPPPPPPPPPPQWTPTPPPPPPPWLAPGGPPTQPPERAT